MDIYDGRGLRFAAHTHPSANDLHQGSGPGTMSMSEWHYHLRELCTLTDSLSSMINLNSHTSRFLNQHVTGFFASS